MGIGTSIFLIAVGAILKFAVTAEIAGPVKISTVGVILMIVGVIGLLLSLFFLSQSRSRVVTGTAVPPAEPRVRDREYY